MSQRTYYSVTGVIFLIIALLHLGRVIYGWEAVIGGWAVPLWLSGVAVVVAGCLSYCGLTPHFCRISKNTIRVDKIT